MLTNLLKNKKVFIFDMDGTLIKSLGIWDNSDSFVIKELTGLYVPPVELGAFRDKFLGECKSDNPYYDYVVCLKKKYNIECDIEDLIEYRKTVCYEALNTLKLKPYAYELLTLLKSLGYKLCLATCGAKDSLARILYQIEETKVLGDNIFDIILKQGDIINLKPAPDIHLKLKELIGFDNEEAVVIEDSLVGLEAARNAGLDCIIVKEEYHQNEDEIKKNAKFYINSLEELYNCVLEIAKNKPKIR